jgi:uncharacterized membrane protein YkvA (DUF1232 family)
MTDQKQTDSVLASLPPNGDSRRGETSSPAEAAARPRLGMTDRPLYHQPPSESKSDAGIGRIRRLRRLIRHIPLIGRTVAAYYCARDRETPLAARLALFGALGYFIMPFDLIPDFLPGIGHLDDAAVLLLALRFVAHRVTPAHRELAQVRIDRWVG